MAEKDVRLSAIQASLILVSVAILVTCISVLPLFLIRAPPTLPASTTVASYKQLTSGNWNDFSPAYSPNGQIAFVSDRFGQPSLYLMRDDGSGVTNLFESSTVANISNPRFNPAGSEVAFVATFKNGSSSLFVVGIDGKGLDQLVQSRGNIESLTWSPNGRTIAYDEFQNGTWSIWLVNAYEGSENVLLLPRTSQVNFNYRYPSWGPNGSWIVFSSDILGQYNIWSYNLKAASLNRLSSQGNDTRPAVSPDGASISYVSYYQNNREWTLWVVDANGSNRHLAISDPLQQNPGVGWIPQVSPASYPTWNPSSNGIMFFSNQASNFSKINANVFAYYMTVNVSVYKHIGPAQQLLGSSLIPLVYGSKDIDPSWSNDGLSIVYSQLDMSGHYHIWTRTLAAVVPKPTYG